MRSQLVCRERFHAGCQCSLQAYCSMHHQSRKRTFSSSSSPLIKAHLSKGLLKVIVGPWQVRNLIAEKEMGSIALRHLQETCDGLRPSPSQLCCVLVHMRQDDLKAELSLFY